MNTENLTLTVLTYVALIGIGWIIYQLFMINLEWFKKSDRLSFVDWGQIATGWGYLIILFPMGTVMFITAINDMLEDVSLEQAPRTVNILQRSVLNGYDEAVISGELNNFNSREEILNNYYNSNQSPQSPQPQITAIPQYNFSNDIGGGVPPEAHNTAVPQSLQPTPTLAPTVKPTLTQEEIDFNNLRNGDN